MKKNLIAGVVILFITACTNQSEVDKANHQRDSLASIVNQRDSSLNDFVSAFNEVETNLDSVAVRQNILSMSTENKGELKVNSKDRMNAQITAINNLMEENRKNIAELNKKLKSSDGRNAKFQKMIKVLNEQLAEKDKELASLNEKLSSMNNQLSQLQTSVDTLNTTVAGQTAELHTAYYVIGKSKDLQAAEIIDKSGGVLGIGKTAKLSQHFDESKFTRVDYTQMGVIPVDSKSMKIITTHPEASYSIDRDKEMVKSIVITDPKKFWSASKYLVVVKD